MNLFDYEKPHFKFTHRPIRLFEAFSGYGSQAIALKRLGIEIDHIGISEIDKYAILSHEAIHGKVKNFGDICEIKGKDLIGERIDLFTFSFPCVDLSKAGQQKGLNNTRSGLVFEVIRILKELKELDKLPTVLLMENVPDLLSKKFKEGWTKIYNEIEGLGYTNKVFLMNAKNYGVAQNRERVFMVSMLGDYAYDIPNPYKLEKRLLDYLEPEVDEKYYLSEKLMNTFTDMTNRNGYVRGERFNPHKHAFTISTSGGGRPTDNFIVEPKISYALKSREFQARGWLDEAPTLTARDYKDPKVLLIPETTKKGYAKATDGDGVYLNRPHQKRGTVQKEMTPTLNTSYSDIGVVVRTRRHENGDEIYITKEKDRARDRIYNNNNNNNSFTITTNETNQPSILETETLRIRKLTPREAFRLMDVDDSDIDKILSVVSNSQAYKLAGNSIVVNVLVEIFKKLF